MISISNIAWDVSLDDCVSNLLNQAGVTHIDIAPPKYFPEPSEVTNDDILTVREYWESRGIKPLGMQSLLFGTQGLNVFGSAEIQNKLLQHFSSVFRIGSLLGARKLVFGSPRNRDRSNLSDKETRDIAIHFFRRLGDVAKEYNVVICLEPNPTCYNSNFMTDSRETVEVVRAVNHPNIRMQLDVGAMCINFEPVDITVREVADCIHHIHISEPQLAPLDMKNLYHSDIAQAINKYLPDIPITIEMLTTSVEASVKEIEQSIRVIKNIYQGI